MVERKPLYSIVRSISTGLNPRQNFVLNEDKANYYYVTVKEITTNKVIFSDSTDKITEAAKRIINNRSKLAIGDILFSGIGTIGKVAYVDIPTNNWDCSESVFLIKPNETVKGKYLSYILSSDVAKQQYEKGSAGAIMKGVRKSTLENLLIPLPSLSEQERIVGILDTFTSSIENLKAQISLRRKQYEHYRDKLLDLEGKPGVEMKTLGEIGTFIRGKRFVRTDIVEEGVPCLHYGDFYTTYGLSAKETKTFLTTEKAAKLRFAEKNDVVIVAAGENNIEIGVGVVWFGEKPAAVHDACYIFKHKQNPMYISYYLRSNGYHQQIKKDVSSAKICSISSVGLGRAVLPLPSLEEQSRIVSILDEFEASIKNLEAQLVAREKQYEYYREKLLTFERE